MAPKRKRNEINEASTSAEATTSTRATRSATRAEAINCTRATRGATLRGDAVLRPTVDNPEPRKRKKAKTAAAAKTVIIEHCKQCNSFKSRATQVKKRLKKAVPGVDIVVNPEEPRKGCFEIREEGGGIFVSLLDLEDPFTPLKELDMEKTISDIVEKIQ